MSLCHVYPLCLKDLYADVELQARTKAQQSFIMWPAVPEGSGKKDKKGKQNKQENRKPSSLAIRLNKSLLLPFCGRSELHPKLGLIPFIEPLLMHLNDAWEATC